MDLIWDEKFGLPDETYSVSDKNICFQCIVKKYALVEKKKKNQTQIYLDKIKRGIEYRILVRAINSKDIKFARKYWSENSWNKHAENIPKSKVFDLVILWTTTNQSQ